MGCKWPWANTGPWVEGSLSLGAEGVTAGVYGGSTETLEPRAFRDQAKGRGSFAWPRASTASY
jgi:hypothetical protein